MRVRIALPLSAILVFIGLILLAACSGGGSSSSNGTSTGMVNLTVSDPSTCSAPQGPYNNVYVTIADVKIHQSASAQPADAGWVDLTPNLTPTQVDLLGIANNNCFLASLGANVALTAGSYQQIRIILLDNSQASKVSNNKCGSGAANCVVLASNPNNPQPIQLSSESQTGIKISSGQLAGGQFTIGAGESKDLNIDFNACQSIVIQGNGGYRLKPVLHAGEVSLTSSSVSGKVVDSVTKSPLTGGKVVVALEQPDTSGIDRVVMETVADGNGNFVFCPVNPGTYDVVATGIDGAGIQYAATITTGVQPGNAISQLFLYAQTAPATAPASITGQITTATSSTGTVADISLAALQTITETSGSVMVTIPQAAASSSALSLETAAGTPCPANTDCVSYTAQVPAVAPYVGAFSASNQTWTQSTGSSSYTLDALAFVPGSGTTSDCTPSEQKTAAPIAVTAGTPVTAPALAFTGCQ